MYCRVLDVVKARSRCGELFDVFGVADNPNPTIDIGRAAFFSIARLLPNPAAQLFISSDTSRVQSWTAVVVATATSARLNGLASSHRSIGSSMVDRVSKDTELGVTRSLDAW